MQLSPYYPLKKYSIFNAGFYRSYIGGLKPNIILLQALAILYVAINFL